MEVSEACRTAMHVEQIISSIIIYILLYCLHTLQFINNKFTQAGKTFCLFVFSLSLKKKKLQNFLLKHPG